MGMKYPYRKGISPEIELKKLDSSAKRARMRRLVKDRQHTWWNGPGSRYSPADLDHVVASKHLRIKEFNGADISVYGWPAMESIPKQSQWIDQYSDHGLLYLEVKK